MVVWVLAGGATEAEVERSRASATHALAVDALRAQAPPSAQHVVLLEAGHELAPGALARISEICASSDPAVLYGDDLLDRGRAEPFSKPDFSPELFAYADYIGPLVVIRSDLLAALRGGRSRLETVHDVLTAASENGQPIAHVPEILCVRDQSSPAIRKQAPAGAPVPRRPLVSLVIPTASHGEHLSRCLTSIAELTTYDRYEVVLVDSSGGALREPGSRTFPAGCWVVRADIPFNYSSAVNRGALAARGEYLVLLNDDVEVLSEDWLERMLELALRPGVGVVGAKLVRADGSLQHGGVTIDEQRVFHVLEDLSAESPGYQGLMNAPRNCSAVTGACMMVSAALYRWLGGLDPGFVLEYGDIDLCFRARECGERVAFTPHAVLRHDEFSTRATDAPRADMELFQRRWGSQLRDGDPYYQRAWERRPYTEAALA